VPALHLTVSALFSPLTLRKITFANRAWVAPMCQYSVFAGDGVPTDWHLAHLGSFAIGGFGAIITEATAVTPEGRISAQDTGLWNDEQAQAWARIVEFAQSQGTRIGVQLAHAGRKASTYGFSPAGQGSVPVAEGGWQPVAPSAVAFEGLATPHELTTAEITEVIEQFAAAAQRADAAGFDLVQIHAAHGYLLHQFLSPLSNHREDEWGGDFAGRTRLLIEVVDAVREAFDPDKPVMVRFSGTDWLDGGWTIEETTELAAILKEHGVDIVDVSSGGLAPAHIKIGPGYQVPLAAQVRQGSGLITSAVGLITDAKFAETILSTSQADIVSLARAAQRDPSWPRHAAVELGLPVTETGVPPQYRRAWA
jgi:2,4-dienoyl-CoA reductase-like NADH-dependent reductase (Old Yellow Enzyme family)